MPAKTSRKNPVGVVDAVVKVQSRKKVKHIFVSHKLKDRVVAQSIVKELGNYSADKIQDHPESSGR